jgi:hypothetical protein
LLSFVLLRQERMQISYDVVFAQEENVEESETKTKVQRCRRRTSSKSKTG